MLKLEATLQWAKLYLFATLTQNSKTWTTFDYFGAGAGVDVDDGVSINYIYIKLFNKLIKTI